MALAGELPLERNTQATARMYVLAVVIGGPLGAALVAGLSVRLELDLFLPAEHGGIARGPWAPVGFATAIFACVLCALITWMRQPKGARIAWDDFGITEWDGDGARTCIEWSKLLVTSNYISLRSRSGGSTIAGAALSQGDLPGSPTGGDTIGGQLTLSDDIGRRIDLMQGVQNLTFNDRLNTIDGLAAIAKLVETRPQGVARMLVRSENVAALGMMLGVAGYVGSFLGLIAYSAKPSDEAALLVLGGGALIMLRSIAWFSRARAERIRGPFTAVEIVGGAPGTVLLSDGKQISSRLHPDSALHLRVGPGWLSFANNLETAAMRQTRMARKRSNLLAALSRFTLGAAVLVIGLSPAIAFVNAHTQGPDKRIQLVWRAKDGAAGADIDVIGRRFLVLEEKRALLRNLDDGAQVAELPTRAGCWQATFALSPGSTHAVITCDETQAHLFALANPQQELVSVAGELSIHSVDLGEHSLAIGDYSGLTFIAGFDGKPTTIAQAAGNDGAIHIALCEANNAVAFISLMQGTYKTWLAVDGVTRKLDVDAIGERLTFSPDCSLLAVVDDVGVVLYETATAKRLDVLPLEHQYDLVRSNQPVAFSADGSRLAVFRRTLRVFDVASLQQLYDLNIEWKRNLVMTETDGAAALAFDGNDTIYWLAKYRGVLLRVSLR